MRTLPSLYSCFFLTSLLCLASPEEGFAASCCKTDTTTCTPCEQKPACGCRESITGFPVQTDLSVALDSFRSLPEGSWEGNFGAFVSLDIKTFLPMFFNVQLAGSYGLYDWGGRGSTPFKNPETLQQQGFFTVAASRETPCHSGINFGLAYDWMFNRHLGVFAVNPNLSQVRGQLGYLFNSRNEIGAWASVNTNKSNKESQEIPLGFRAISQANLFYCHYFKRNSAYGMIWAGSPYRRGLKYSSGRAGRFIFGARFFAPLTDHLSINGHGVYMVARSAEEGNESKNYAANVCFALTYSFGYSGVDHTPYMNLADNSNFLVDTNSNF